MIGETFTVFIWLLPESFRGAVRVELWVIKCQADVLLDPVEMILEQGKISSQPKVSLAGIKTFHFVFKS